MNINNLLKNETLIVALATALCYTGAYAYERGFSIYFGIPTELISVTPGSIITTVSLFVVFLMTLYILSSLPISVINNKKLKNKFIVTILLLSPFWIVFNLIFYLTSGFNLLKFSLITAAYCLLCITVASGTTESRTQTQPSNEQRPQSILSKIDNISAFIFWFSFLFFAITSGMGTYIARTIDNFHEFTYKNEQYKLIRSYGDNIIAIKSKDINNQKGVYIFKPEDLTGTRLNQIESKSALSKE